MIPAAYRFAGTVAFAIACIAVPAFAQNVVDTHSSKKLELDQLRERIERATEKQNAQREEIGLLDRDIGAINRALIETAKRGQQLEASVSQAEQEFDAAIKAQSAIKTSLGSKRALLSEVLGALQRMGRNPPPALLVLPEDALASVRSAIVLGAVVPEIKNESRLLFAELAALRESTRKVEEKKAQVTNRLNALAEDETRLTLLVEEKNQLLTRSRTSLVEEQNKAAELASRASSLKDLIASLENQIASATAAANAAKKADEKRRSREEERLAKAQQQRSDPEKASSGASYGSQYADTKRIEPAIAFSKAKGTLPIPANGIELYGFGSPLQSQKRSTGIALATRPNARVRAPADSWVSYAGPFRSYGQVIILNAGEGYRIILAGLAEINVTAGRFVLAGEPIGRMGITRFAAALPPDLGSNKPILSVEFRKDGISVDPSPWWGIRSHGSTQASSGAGKKNSSGRGTLKGSKNDS